MLKAHWTDFENGWCFEKRWVGICMFSNQMSARFYTEIWQNFHCSIHSTSDSMENNNMVCTIITKSFCSSNRQTHDSNWKIHNVRYKHVFLTTIFGHWNSIFWYTWSMSLKGSGWVCDVKWHQKWCFETPLIISWPKNHPQHLWWCHNPSLTHRMTVQKSLILVVKTNAYNM